MDVLELLGRDRAEPELSGDLAVPDYPPADDSAPIYESDLLEPDPAPKHDRKAARSAGPVKKATASQQRQIRDAMELMLITLGGGIAFRDPHCGGSITDNAENIAAKAVPLIARNPRWVEWFCGSTGFLDVMGLLIALRPVGSTFWSHHVSHSIEAGGEQVDLSRFTAPDL